MVPGAGIEPAWMINPRDFKSLASTYFATRAMCNISYTSILTFNWRLGPESNRGTRLCRPLHNHSATQPYKCEARIVPGLRQINNYFFNENYSEVYFGAKSRYI